MLCNPDKPPFDGDETIIVVQPRDALRELLMPPLKIFDLAPFPPLRLPPMYLHISWMAVRNDKKKKEEDYNREIGSAGTSNDQSR